MNRLTASEKRELAYHNRCRDVCEKLGTKLYASSINGGFTTTDRDEIGHQLFETLERWVAHA